MAWKLPDYNCIRPRFAAPGYPGQSCLRSSGQHKDRDALPSRSVLRLAAELQVVNGYLDQTESGENLEIRRRGHRDVGQTSRSRGRELGVVKPEG